MFENYLKIIFKKEIEFKDLIIPKDMIEYQQQIFDEIIDYQLKNNFKINFNKKYQIQNMKIVDEYIEYNSQLGIKINLKKEFDSLKENAEYYNKIRDNMQKQKCNECQLQQYCPYDIPTIDKCDYTIKFQQLVYRNLITIYNNKKNNNKTDEIQYENICKDFKVGVLNEQ